jgi:hypothetical protein
LLGERAEPSPTAWRTGGGSRAWPFIVLTRWQPDGLAVAAVAKGREESAAHLHIPQQQLMQCSCVGMPRNRMQQRKYP